MILRTFRWPFVTTAAGLVLAYFIPGAGGFDTVAIVAILAILEISLSFDNAVVNATILVRMNEFWVKLFLSVGILIAVFGMRLVFPLAVVALTGGLSPVQVFDLALNNQAEYAARLTAAKPQIALFGGMFLLMIFLEFMFDEEREVKWIKPLERPLAAVGRLDSAPALFALAALVAVVETLVPPADRLAASLAGVLGIATHLAVNGLGELFESSGAVDDTEAAHEAAEGSTAPVEEVRKGVATGEVAKAGGKAAFFLFLYLEVLDASFSFDGVIGAFAISTDIFVIALGLGIGAFYIRSLTVYLVHQGTLTEYPYLEHGAHYAIGALAVLLFVGVEHEIPEIVTGLIGVGFIAAALVGSILRRRREGDGGDSGSEAAPQSSGSAALARS